jgi:hypothetical protein
MKDIPTAKELFDKMLEENDECTSTEMMIEFAKLHVEQALKEASEIDVVSGRSYKHRAEHDKKSILNSYPSSNIK